MEYLDATHPEWPGMWEELASHSINHGDPVCANQGMSWEYMGSTENHHNFRHAKHPTSGRVEHIYIERYMIATHLA